jgi:hypothetical protein
MKKTKIMSYMSCRILEVSELTEQRSAVTSVEGGGGGGVNQ